MLDSTKSKRPVFEVEKRSIAPEPWRDGIGFRIYLAKIRQLKLMIVRLMFLGAIMVSLAGLAYCLIRTPAFTASSELLISNTTLQLSGPDAVVTQILVENTLIQSAIEMLKSSSVLERVVDRLGLENIELILPKSRNIRDLPLSQLFAPERERSETSRRQSALAALRSNITVNRVGASQIISVRGRALTAEDAARLTNEVAGSFVKEQNDTNAVVTTSASLRERIKVLGPAARIISEAVPPGTKDGPTAAVLLALAAIVGAVLGMSAGLAVALFDQRVRSAEQLAVISAECFGYLPRMMVWRELRWRRGGRFVAWMLRKLSLYGLAFDYPDAELASILRCAVLRRARSAVLERCGSVPHFVGITSCLRAEGKTTLAAHWAGLIAGDGSRVLLIDASPDDAALSNRLTPGKTQGLYDLLRGAVRPGDVIRAEVRPNLDFLPSGQAVANIDMQWFNLADAVRALGDCSYEWVILDLPALTPVADVRSAGQILDELLIVVEWGRTSESRLEQTLQSLGPVRDKVLGAVINKAPWASLDSETRLAQRAARNASSDANIRKPDGKSQLRKWCCQISIILGIALALAVSPAFGDDYRLGVSDRLKIKVQEWPDLGGEYAVAADGSVSLPLIGDINAAGLRVKELAQEISDRLQRRAGGAERPFTAVEIIQFRPFSIMGDVQRPGEYPYRPGLTVLKALGVAGGYYRPELGLLRLERDIALAKGDIRTLLLKQNRLVARASRLTAALAGQENVPIPPELMNQKDNPAISAILESEREALALENDTARSEASALENIRSLYEREIGSLRGQVEAMTREQGTIQQQLKELRSLSARGLALSPTLFTLERTLAQIANEQMSAETAIVRAEESITLAEQRVREHALERSRTNTRDLQQAKDEIAEVRARIATADDLLKEAQLSAPAEARERLSVNSQRPSFTLVRKDGEITREIAADETTLIEPNDVIKVPITVPQSLAASGYMNLSRVGRSQETEP